MNISKKQWIVVGVVIVAVIAALSWFRYAKAPTLPNAGEPTSTASSTVPTNTTASSTETATTSNVIKQFPINSADKIVSWTFKGAYTGNNTLVAQANADIANLTSMFGKGTYDDYDLYLGIGNDDILLGDGAGAYKNYNHSISIHPKKGLAYANLGHLMNELGAYNTAADAYAKAVAVESGMLEYHIERLNYLTKQFPNNRDVIASALSDANKAFGDNASILVIEAKWLAGQKDYSGAIKIWELAKTLSPGKDTTAMDTEIARLQAKL